jgi:hypothetical protein
MNDQYSKSHWFLSPQELQKEQAVWSLEQVQELLDHEDHAKSDGTIDTTSKEVGFDSIEAGLLPHLATVTFFTMRQKETIQDFQSS